jgi:hypothetical protein
MRGLDPPARCVWTVSEGRDYEGSEVRSVHATRESALAKAESLRQQHAGPWFPSTDQKDMWKSFWNSVVIQEWDLE